MLLDLLYDEVISVLNRVSVLDKSVQFAQKSTLFRFDQTVGSARESEAEQIRWQNRKREQRARGE